MEIRQYRNDDAKALIKAASQKLYSEAMDQFGQLVGISIDNAARTSSEGTAQYARSKIQIVGLLVASLMLGAALASSIGHIVSRPLHEAMTVARRVAGGDLTAEIAAVSNDKTGQLMQALKEMNHSLARIVGQVRCGTEAIAAVSGQIAGGNHDLSKHTEVQHQADDLAKVVNVFMLNPQQIAARADADAIADKAPHALP